MNKKAVSMVLVAVVVIVVVVVVGVAAYWALSNNGGEEGPTPTPTPAASVEDATSLGFKVNATIEDNNELYAFTAKNLGTSDVLLRVDEIDADGNTFIYVYNQTAQSLWIQYAGEWTDSSATFSDYWDGANSGIIGYTAFSTYQSELAANWSSGAYDYDSDGNTYHIYDIDVNPTVADSLFAVS
jgi:hypothetical protein